MAHRHTIVLMQTSQNRATRTFMDYDSISQAMDGICGLYERKLKELNPAIRNITYDIDDLYNFIDGLADLSALVYDHSIQAYLPYDRQWIKQKTFQHLKKLAARWVVTSVGQYVTCRPETWPINHCSLTSIDVFFGFHMDIPIPCCDLSPGDLVPSVHTTTEEFFGSALCFRT
ncbi:hypothetical protein Nepgr_012402 [Nepenthes gracilis]|uniref:Enhancer of rudimentary homolog n=1 Tax=Nepenthes gracilis TaxID=150966 RepID=A0AAD3XNA3_NEPGR|nr:hypothetical protein Nepgr_012402 [Nepenthes gracilis]